MSITLKLFLLSILFVQLVFIIFVVRKNKLTIKYASFWIILMILLAFVTIFPNIVFRLSEILGFEKASNMVFLLGFFFLFYIIFILLVSISIQNEKIRLLVQEISLLKENFENDEKK